MELMKIGYLDYARWRKEWGGIPMLEMKYRGNPEFEEYAGKTSAFFPWFPKGKRDSGENSPASRPDARPRIPD